MDDVMGKVGKLLSDEESVKQITEIAQMLMSSNDKPTESVGVSEETDEVKGSPSDDCSQQDTETSKNEDDNLFGGFDFSMLFKIQEIMNFMNQKDKNADLLIALKPHMNSERKQKIDKAVKLMKLVSIWGVLKDMGILKEFIEPKEDINSKEMS